LNDLIEKYYNIEQDTLDQLLTLVPEVLQISSMQLDNLDFDDMIYQVSRMSGLIKWPAYDWIFVDESQDINQAQLFMVKRLVEESGRQGRNPRVVVFGDTNQAIYGFRGADSTAMQSIANSLNIKQCKPLTISHRCSLSHIVEAQKLVPGIRAALNAPTGTITENILAEEAIEKIKIGDLVICPKNAPMIKFAVKLWKKGIKVRVLGEQFCGEMLDIIVRFVEEYGNEWDRHEFELFVDDYKDKKHRFYRSTDQGHRHIFPAEMNKALVELAKIAESADKLKNIIQELFHDEPSVEAVTCSSIHRAKGAEAE